ncbi:MAG: hypothetical protein F4Y92_02170 [Dehalococcoidia bacterium]|nr:hypothetical protein [Dehalococcoidia bacterium]
MTRVLLSGLVALIAVGGAFSAFAANRAAETTVELEMEFWVSLSSSSAFVSTRQEGEEWVTHDFTVPLEAFPGAPTLLVSEPVTLSVPITVAVPAEEPIEASVYEPSPAAVPHVALGEAPSGRASCCRVRGMWDDPAAQRAIASEMRKVIAYARTNMGLTHRGPITINVAYAPRGLLVRYAEAFGVELEELPDECAFQRGEHFFFTPRCRADETEIARQWFTRATEAYYVSARWAGVATSEYYFTLYQSGEAPTLRDDRYRSAIFHQPATDFRQGRGHDDLMVAAALYAIESYGTFEDWESFYEDLLGGEPVHTAFESAFGVTLARFYREFEGWAERERAELLALAYGSCREAARYLAARAHADGGGFPDYRVPLEHDDDGDGYVCEQYARFPEEELVCTVVGELSSQEEQ